eukprot:gnl/TRDRNA2_/TRDRNA2_80121_c1_seq1.p1 gnl/TRDRNA2_/TRDRNA2_80121_c1~~gnl/TRDRNA2_/TRDRNA2_80121_c1_seq1.p1  ORF type:complete len:164 (+),score=16.56 gnl/TRDRNA2_/TRDRNA2_80121_c1_seq1:117-608(+)
MNRFAVIVSLPVLMRAQLPTVHEGHHNVQEWPSPPGSPSKASRGGVSWWIGDGEEQQQPQTPKQAYVMRDLALDMRSIGMDHGVDLEDAVEQTALRTPPRKRIPSPFSPSDSSWIAQPLAMAEILQGREIGISVAMMLSLIAAAVARMRCHTRALAKEPLLLS